MMAWKKWILTLVILPAAVVVFAQSNSDRAERWDSLFDYLSQNNKAMGSVAIARKGKVVYSRAFGYSAIDAASKTKATTKTKYRIGSVTKMFTAVMIFQLIEEKKLSLSTTIDAYFPTIPNAKIITIGQLLAHRSGLYNITNDPNYHQWKMSPKTKQEMLAVISGNPAEFSPDAKANYCNSNYILLGHIIERVCGKPYKEVLKERITSEIGLKNTIYGSTTDLDNNESYSYDPDASGKNWVKEDETDMSIFGGAGSLLSTPSDLITFINALFGDQLLEHSSLTQMTTIVDGFGMGILPFSFGTIAGYGHYGNIDGFSAELYTFPDQDLSVAYCTNGQAYPVADILTGILNIAFDKPYSIAAAKSTPPPPPAATGMDRYIGIYRNYGSPIVVTISIWGTTLMAQVAGQAAVAMTAISPGKYLYAPGGMEIDFSDDADDLILRQGTNGITFTRVK